MTSDSADLSTRRLMRRYLRQIRWQWRHAPWRINRDVAFFDWQGRSKNEIYDTNMTALARSHRLLTERGWPMPRPQN